MDRKSKVESRKSKVESLVTTIRFTFGEQQIPRFARDDIGPGFFHKL